MNMKTPKELPTPDQTGFYRFKADDDIEFVRLSDSEDDYEWGAWFVAFAIAGSGAMIVLGTAFVSLLLF